MNIKRILLILSVFCSAGFLFYWLPHQLALKDDIYCDLNVYISAVTHLKHHQSLYVPLSMYGPDRLPIWYFYPPQFAVFFLSIRKLGINLLSHNIWLPLLALSLIIYAFTCSYIVRGNTRTTYSEAFIWATILFFSPSILDAIGVGNIDMLLLALLGLGFAFPRFAPALFAIVGQVKVYALLALLVLWIRERRGFIQAGIPLALGCLLGICVCGFESYIEWKKLVATVITQGTFSPANLSLSFALLRILHGLHIWHYISGPLPFGPRLYLQTASIIGPLVTVYFCRRLPNQKLYAIAIFSTLLFSPLCWPNYLAFGYILVALYLRDWLPIWEARNDHATERNQNEI